jgi:ABC-type dipeptide/oligopeptide/nickel transport system permease component
LDKPLWRQYTDYLGNFLHGDLGYSIGTDTFGSPVSNLIKDELPQTLTLGGYALLLSLYIGLPIGLVSALKQNSLLDHGSQAIMVVLFAVPPFVLAPVCQLIFADQLHWLPVTGWNLPGEEVQDLVMPVVIFAVGIAGFLSKSFRSFMLEVLQQDYIRTARAKGLKERTIIYLHACKNTLLPLASIVGPLISFLVTGAFIIERAFGVPGIAGDTVSAVQENNGPLIEATTLLLALAVVVVNMLTDIFYAMVDPRVKL